MKLAVRADPETDVPAVLEGLGNLLETHDLFVELRALREVVHVECDVIEFQVGMRSARLRKEKRSGHKGGER